jgi:hypothetical protein
MMLRCCVTFLESLFVNRVLQHFTNSAKNNDNGNNTNEAQINKIYGGYFTWVDSHWISDESTIILKKVASHRFQFMVSGKPMQN